MLQAPVDSAAPPLDCYWMTTDHRKAVENPAADWQAAGKIRLQGRSLAVRAMGLAAWLMVQAAVRSSYQADPASVHLQRQSRSLSDYIFYYYSYSIIIFQMSAED